MTIHTTVHSVSALYHYLHPITLSVIITLFQILYYSFIVNVLTPSILNFVLHNFFVFDSIFLLLRTLKKQQSAASSQSMQEGRAFEQRLRIIIEQKLCKKKFQLITDTVDAADVSAVAVVAEIVATDAGGKKVKPTKKMLEQQREEKEIEEKKRLEEQQEREESSSELRREVTALTAEIFKYLACTIAPLRPVALSALLCLTRAAVSTPNTDVQCKAAISLAVQTAFKEFSSKKNSRLAPKIFEELIQRYPDFCVASFLDDLVSSCASAKSSFLRAECCRLLSEILKRQKSLQTGTLDLVDSSIINIVTSLGGAITINFSVASEKEEVVEKEEKVGKKGKKNKKDDVATIVEKNIPMDGLKDGNSKMVAGNVEKEKETRAKRLKPLLLCAKELASLLKSQRGKTSKNQEDAVKALLTIMQSEGVRSSSSSSTAVQRLTEQVVQLLTVATGEDNKSKKEKAESATAASSLMIKANEGGKKVEKREEKKEEKKARKEPKEDKMVTSSGQVEQEDGDDALPIGEYVLVGAKGPNFKKKKGDKKESEEDRQVILDAAEKQLIKKMHEEKRTRADNEEANKEVEVEKKRKWHE